MIIDYSLNQIINNPLMCTKLLLLLLLCLTACNLLPAQQPSRIWASYFGYSAYYPNVYTSFHNSTTNVTASVYDPKSKCLYVAGVTNDTSGVATQGSFKAHFVVIYKNYGTITYTPPDVFLAKFDTLGHCIWSTYYGGNGDELTPDLTVDTNGNVYLSGITNSDSGIATAGSYRPDYPSNAAAINYYSGVPFLVKFDSSGQRLWGTYLGGNSSTNLAVPTYVHPIRIACNRQNNKIYVLGLTYNPSGIATPGAFKETADTGYYDLFLAEFNTAGVKQWATYYGGEKGAGCDNCFLYVDNSGGGIYLLGYTQSKTGIATTGTMSDTLADTALGNLFLAKFNSGGQRQWGTYIPTKDHTLGFSIVGGGDNNAVYVSGYTTSTTGIASSGAYQDTIYGSYGNVFLLQCNTLTGKKLWGTYYGGGYEYNYPFTNYNYFSYFTQNPPYNNLALDAAGHILMIGSTTSPQHIEKGCHPYLVSPASHRLGFITRWDPNGDLEWGSYYNVALNSIATVGNNAFYLVGGITIYDSLATPGVAQTDKTPGKTSGYIAKLSENMACPPQHFAVTEQNRQLSVDPGYAAYQWYQNGTAIQGADQYQYTASDSGSFYVVVSDSCGCSYHSDTVNVATTGIAEAAHGNLMLSLYPNPNDGNFLLSGNLINAGKIEQVYYQLTDVLGNVLKSSSFAVNKPSFKKALNFSGVANGIYFLKISCGKGNKTIKLVKNQ